MKKIFTLFFIIVFFSFPKSGFVCAESTNNSSALLDFYNGTNAQLWNSLSKPSTTPLLTRYAVNCMAPVSSVPSLINKKSLFAFTHSNPAKTFTTHWFNTRGKYISVKTFEIKEGAGGKNKNAIHFYVSRYASNVYVITSAGEKKRKQTLTLSKE